VDLAAEAREIQDFLLAVLEILVAILPLKDTLAETAELADTDRAAEAVELPQLELLLIHQTAEQVLLLP
jgi:hypothetical protein